MRGARDLAGRLPNDGRTVVAHYCPRIFVLQFSSALCAGSDGWLWHVVYDGSDGAAWGDYNLGYNTRGSRLQATGDLVAAIRAV